MSLNFATPWDPDKAAAELRRAPDRRALAAILGLPYADLTWILWSPEYVRYKPFEIQKRSGGTRLIEAPVGPLAALQRRLADLLLRLYQPPRCVHGFVRARGIVTNAREHVGKSEILNLDLSDYFHSITGGRLFKTLRAKPYDLKHEVAHCLAHICCHNGRLPQGAATSPIAANIVTRPLDNALTRLIARTGIVYTRYADDLTFSTRTGHLPGWLAVRGPSGSATIAPSLQEAIEGAGFHINSAKVRIRAAVSRQLVTGLVVNEQVNVRRGVVRRVRSLIDAIWRFGLERVAARRYPAMEAALAATRLRRSLLGELSFIGHVKGRESDAYRRLAHRASQVLSGDDPYAAHSMPSQHSAKRTEDTSSRESMIRLLHLSDFHFASDENWAQKPLLAELSHSLARITGETGRIDYVAFTGDIANTGAAEEYKAAREWLEESLLPSLGLGRDAVLAVPGNHDVQRKTVEKAARSLRRNILDQEGHLDELFGSEPAKKLILSGLQTYSREFGAWFGEKPSEVWWKRTIVHSSGSIDVAGLCSPILSYGEISDQGALAFGYRQITECMPHSATRGDLVIALGHHPLYYLNDIDRPAKDAIAALSNVYLHGHIHDQDAKSSARPARASFVEIAAGAAYAGHQYRNSFNIIAIEPRRKVLELSTYIWIARDQSWRIDRNAFNGASSAQFSLEPDSGVL